MGKISEVCGMLAALVILAILCAVVASVSWLSPLETSAERWEAEKRGPFG